MRVHSTDTKHNIVVVLARVLPWSLIWMWMTLCCFMFVEKQGKRFLGK